MHEMISVIVPAYNNAPWLPRCLNSLLAQSYPNLEILVINDGSTDDTLSVLQEFERMDSRIRCFHKENGGVTRARLLGVQEAKGEWITFVDADDWIEPDMYARLMENARRFQVDISHCGHRMDYPDGSSDYYYNTGMLRRQDRLTGLRDLLEEKIVEPGLCNKVYRRSLFDGLQEKIDLQIKNNEDLLMNFYVFSQAETSVFEDICPYHYVIREGSASRRKPNAHTIYDPIRVKEIILAQCGPELREDVCRAMVATTLFAYAQLCRDMGKQYAPDRKKVRGILRQQCIYTPLLSQKNKVLLCVICHTPWVFHLVYGVYYHLLKKK